MKPYNHAKNKKKKPLGTTTYDHAKDKKNYYDSTRKDGRDMLLIHIRSWGRLQQPGI